VGSLMKRALADLFPPIPSLALRSGRSERTELSSEGLFFGGGIRLVLPYRKITGGIAVNKTDLSNLYRDYIGCLNNQDWPKLEQFVDDDVRYNGRRIGISGYREMLERDFREIPDLYFHIHLLISDPPYIASRLCFDCTPKGTFLGLDVNGKKVSFTENVFYQFESGKIEQVWSVIDKAAIEAQL
jgi:predicted ester cyclase